MRLHGRQQLFQILKEAWTDIPEKEIYAAILSGEIYVDGARQRNPKALIHPGADFTRIRPRFVSRGGEKLNSALDALTFNVSGRVCLDAGASTGGFTDCLLQRGASSVHAVDVGYNQLSWKLRSDNRVIVHEKTNIMHIEPQKLIPQPEMAVADLAFRSLRGAASRLLLLTAGGPVLALLKPQFEAAHDPSFDGVIRSVGMLRRTVLGIVNDLNADHVYVQNAVTSSITGRRGNVEIFLLLSGEKPEDTLRVESCLEVALAIASRKLC